MEVKLHKNFEATGNTWEGFEDAILSIDNATSLISCRSEDLSMAAILDDYEDAQEAATMFLTDCESKSFDDTADYWQQKITKYSRKDCWLFFYMSPQNRTAFRSIDKEYFRKRDFSKELIAELSTQSKMLIINDEKFYAVSPLAFTTLLRRAGLGGDTMNSPCLGRVLEIFKSLQWRNVQDVSIIARHSGNANMILAVHSDKYCYMPQTILCDIYHEIAANLGNPKCDKWVVNHEISCCYVNFPEVGEDFAATYDLPNSVVPGIYFGTSDSGDSSLTIRGYWKVNGHILGGECYKRSHRGEIDVADFVTSVGNKFFAQYNKVPERLCELLKIKVHNPSATIKRVLKEIGMVNVLGKKKSDMLWNALSDEFVRGGDYTAYHIAMAIASLPERCYGISRTYIEKLEDIATKAIFAKYDTTHEPSIVLLP